MNRTRAGLILAAVLLVGAGLGYALSQLGVIGGTSRAMAQGPKTVGDKGRVLYWHDPMVPNVKFDKPGKSPYMDMQLVPVYANDTQTEGAVHVSSSVSQSLGIRLARVEKTAMNPRLAAVGSVAFDERLLELVQARVEGYVTKLYVKSPLEQVRRGERLAEVLSPQWQAVQEEYVALLAAQSERGQSIRNAARRRLSVLGVPDDAVAALEKAGKVRATTTLFAPIDGVVTELSVREGAAFMPGAPLFRINGLATVWVNAQVPEAQLAMVSMGSRVTARVSGWPAEAFPGRILALLPDIDAQTRTGRVRVALDNPKQKLSPGMFVSLDFTADDTAPQLTVPSEAVIMTGERNVVVVARDGGGFDVVEVTVGAEVDGKTQIVAGLEEAQSVVTSGQFLIDSEASLRSTVSRLGAATSNDSHSTASSDSAHRAEGRVTAIDDQGITISHGPVPSLQWPAMTMKFQAAPQTRPAEVTVGTRVSFSFTESGSGAYRIERITALDAAAQGTKSERRP